MENTGTPNGGLSDLNSELDVKDLSICPHNNSYLRCNHQECIDEMIDSEAYAYCPHGFLAGCPTCR